MKYGILNSTHEHIFNIKISFNKKTEIQAVLEQKFAEVAQSTDEKYHIKGFPQGKLTIDIVRKYFGDQLAQDVVQSALLEALKSITLQEKLPFYTILHIFTILDDIKFSDLTYVCSLLLIKDYKQLASQVSLDKPIIKITDSCLEFHILINRIMNSKDFFTIDGSQPIERFDAIDLHIIDTNIPKLINTTQLTFIIGTEELFFEIEDQFIDKRVGEFYTITSRLGFISCIILGARRLTRIISTEELAILKNEDINQHLKGHKEMLERSLIKATHLFLCVQLKKQLIEVLDSAIPKNMVRNLMCQRVPSSVYESNLFYESAMLNYIFHVLIPNCEDSFYQNVDLVDERTLDMFGYISENKTDTEIKNNKVLYNSVNCISAHIKFAPKHMTLREFSQELAILALTTIDIKNG